MAYCACPRPHAEDVEIELHHLLAFQKVAQERSVTRAAARLHMSQPALSAKIRVLEAELGRKLFVRRGHGVELSEAGKLFLTYTESALRLLDDGREAVRGTGSARSSLAIGCVPSVSLSCLPSALWRFGREHPHVGVTVRAGTSGAVFELLLARIVQVAIITQGLHARGLERVVLGHDPIRLVAAPGHPLADRAEISMDDLSGHHLVLANWGAGYDDFEERIHNQRIDPPPTRVQIDPTHAAMRMVEQGFGVAFLPHLVVHDCLTRGSLNVIRVSELPAMSRQVSAVFHQQSRNLPVTTMINAMAQIVDEISPKPAAASSQQNVEEARR